MSLLTERVNGSVAVKGNIREGTRSRGMPMATKLSEMSIIQLLLMHLVLLLLPSSCDVIVIRSD